jgi:hypothetical protein
MSHSLFLKIPVFTHRKFSSFVVTQNYMFVSLSKFFGKMKSRYVQMLASDAKLVVYFKHQRCIFKKIAFFSLTNTFRVRARSVIFLLHFWSD